MYGYIYSGYVALIYSSLGTQNLLLHRAKTGESGLEGLTKQDATEQSDEEQFQQVDT